MSNGMDAFFTREKANNGVVVPLYLPDGTKSEHSLTIRGIDSDFFRQAEADARRKAMDITQLEDTLEKTKAIQEAKLQLIAALVIGWTFPEEATPLAVVNFLREAPQIANAVDQVASKRSLFFAQGSSSLPASQKPSSGSTKSHKDPSKASAPA